jgi:hypothetical protein
VRVAGAGVVDGHVQGEIIRIDAQLAEFIGTDQQMQGQLFVPQVIADDFGQALIAALTQRQLHGALQITLIGDRGAVL